MTTLTPTQLTPLLTELLLNLKHSSNFVNKHWTEEELRTFLAAKSDDYFIPMIAIPNHRMQITTYIKDETQRAIISLSSIDSDAFFQEVEITTLTSDAIVSAKKTLWTEFLVQATISNYHFAPYSFTWTHDLAVFGLNALDALTTIVKVLAFNNTEWSAYVQQKINETPGIDYNSLVESIDLAPVKQSIQCEAQQ